MSATKIIEDLAVIITSSKAKMSYSLSTRIRSQTLLKSLKMENNNSLDVNAFKREFLLVTFSSFHCQVWATNFASCFTSRIQVVGVNLKFFVVVKAAIYLLSGSRKKLELEYIFRRVATCKPGKPGLTSFSETLALFFIQFLSFWKMKV